MKKFNKNLTETCDFLQLPDSRIDQKFHISCKIISSLTFNSFSIFRPQTIYICRYLPHGGRLPLLWAKISTLRNLLGKPLWKISDQNFFQIFRNASFALDAYKYWEKGQVCVQISIHISIKGRMIKIYNFKCHNTAIFLDIAHFIRKFLHFRLCHPLSKRSLTLTHNNNLFKLMSNWPQLRHLQYSSVFLN